jgi:hypothetical protein
MATTQDKETPCVAISISNHQKCHASLFIFYVFSSTTSENRRVEQVLLGRGGWHCGRGRWQGKR